MITHDNGVLVRSLWYIEKRAMAPIKAHGIPTRAGDTRPKPCFITLPPTTAATAFETLNAICMPAAEHFASFSVSYNEVLQGAPDAEKQCRREKGKNK